MRGQHPRQFQGRAQEGGVMGMREVARGPRGEKEEGGGGRKGLEK